MDGPVRGPVWKVLQLPSSSVLQHLDLRVESLDEKLLGLVGGFVSLHLLYLRSSVWNCSWVSIHPFLSF